MYIDYEVCAACGHEVALYGAHECPPPSEEDLARHEAEAAAQRVRDEARAAVMIARAAERRAARARLLSRLCRRRPT